MGVSQESGWATFADVSDSAASTFTLGEPPPYTPAVVQAPVAQAPQFSVNHSSPLDRPSAPAEPSQNNTPSSPATPSPMQTPSSTPPSDFPRTAAASRSVEILVGGNWIHGFVVKKEDGKSFVRYFPRGKPAQTTWATDDQLRPLTPQRMREEIDASLHPEHLGSAPSTATPSPTSSDAQPQGTRVKPVTPSVVPASTPAEDLTVDSAIKLLGSSSAADRANAAKFLVTVPPDDAHRSAVVKLLTGMLAEGSGITQRPAAQALAAWADDATERAFIARLAAAPREERRGIFEMLGARKTAAAARAIAARLRVSEDVIAAGDQLESMGSVAEPAVRELVADKETSVAKYAVDVLATIGTKESLPALEKASESDDSKLAGAASSAMQRIQSRL
jgi:hypothetical protein